MTDHVQPDWSKAPAWANFWAVDSDGYAYWYRDQPKFDYEIRPGQGEWLGHRDDTSSAGGWLRPSRNGTAGVWLRPWETEESGSWLRAYQSEPMDVKYDSSWPPEEFDNWDIEWDKTLRSR